MTPVSKLSLALLFSTSLVACADNPGDERSAVSMQDTAATGAVASSGTSVPAAMLGRWSMRVLPATGDSTLAQYELEIREGESSITFPGRDPIASRLIAAGGDSMAVESGPYPSALRDGVNVRTNTVFRLQGDRLVGTTVARYETTGADSVVHLRSEGTRLQ